MAQPDEFLIRFIPHNTQAGTGLALPTLMPQMTPGSNSGSDAGNLLL
jgi:hypothetical protein